MTTPKPLVSPGNNSTPHAAAQQRGAPAPASLESDLTPAETTAAIENQNRQAAMSRMVAVVARLR
jgi:hypothetical protein